MAPGVLINRNFALLFLTQLVSQLGTSLYVIVLVFWLKGATNSASLMSLLVMLSVIPGIVLGPFAGVLVDRYSRRNLLVISDFLTACVILGTGALMLVAPTRTDLILAVLPVVIVLKGGLWAIFQTTLSAVVPDLVPTEKIRSSNALLQTSMRVSELAGQFIGGVVFVVLGAAPMMFANGSCFLLSSISATFLKFREKHRRMERHGNARVSLRADVQEGLQYVRQVPGLTSLVVVSATNNFYYGPLIVLLPFYIEHVLHLTPEWYGFLMAAITIGTLLGALLAKYLSAAVEHGKFVIYVLFSGVATLTALGVTSSGPIAALLLMSTGALSGMATVLLSSAIQRTVLSQVRGRVFGFSSTISSALIAVSIGLSGVVAEAVNHDIALIYGACGILWAAAPIYLIAGGAVRLLNAAEQRDCLDATASDRQVSR